MSDDRYERLRRRLDREHQYRLIAGFPQELLAADRAAAGIRGVSRAPQVVVAGMGGSAIAGDLAACAASESGAVPVTVCRDYRLPPFVTRNTLVIASSYSGNTEETLAAHAEATRKKARVFCLTTGGELLRRAKKLRQPHLVLPPGMPPRAALPSGLAPLVRLLERA